MNDGVNASPSVLVNERAESLLPPIEELLRPRDLHRTLPGYEVTPITPLDESAAYVGVRHVFVKDESDRLGLPSFKILGGAWAVHRLVMARAGRDPAEGGLEALRDAARGLGGLTLATATDGNHGRGVAYMAHLLGFEAVVYVPRGTAKARIDAIASEGASVVVHPGNYDQAVARAAADAASNGWEVVADVAYAGYTDVPTWVMDGYDTIFDECDEQLPVDPTVVVVQAGVGALTGAAIRHYGARGGGRPSLATVEPLTAACLQASAARGVAVTIDAGTESIMAGLNCGTPSLVAWPYIEAGVSVFLTVPDERAREAMRRLAEVGIVAGESGAASLAGLVEAARYGDARRTLGLDRDACVLLINTEGATDPQAYEEIVGRSPEEVGRAAGLGPHRPGAGLARFVASGAPGREASTARDD